MPKAIKCTISGLEISLKDDIAMIHYVGRSSEGIALIGIPLTPDDDNVDIPHAVVLRSERHAKALLKIINSAVKIHFPDRKIKLSINRLDASSSYRNNRISLKYMTRTIN